MSEDAIITRETRVGRVKELWPKLTDRQKECLCLYLMGFTMDEAGQVLGISKQAVSQSLQAILDKLG